MNSIIRKNYQQIFDDIQRPKDYEEKYNSHTVNIVFLNDIDIESYFHEIEINHKTTMAVYKNMSRSRRDVPFETVLDKMNKNEFLEIVWKSESSGSIQIRISSKMMVLLHTDLNPRQITFPIPPYKKIFIKNFKKTIQFTLNKRWSRYIFAHLVSVHPMLRHNMSYLEIHNPCSGRKKEIVWLCIDNVNTKIILTIKEKTPNSISIKFADDYSVHVKSYHYDYVNQAILYMRKVLVIYEEMFDEINEIYKIDTNIDISPNKNSIKYLKSIYPDFFVSGYSRECPNLPIVITKDEVDAYESVLEYPLGSGRYFAAQPGLFIGIKKNRLSNSAQYPFLVNCYPTDHKGRFKSQYMKYYYPAQYKESPIIINNKDSVPTNLLVKGIERIQLSYTSMYSILEWVFGKSAAANLPMQLCRQSFWCDIDIKFSKDDHRLYCLYEYIFNTNIFLLQVNNNHLAHVVLPPHRNDYIWNPKYNRSVVIVREIKGAYGMRDNVYSILAENDKYIFNNSHPLSKSVIETKLSCTIRGTKIDSGYTEQYIDENGKCTLLKREDGSVMNVYCEPQNLNTFEEILDEDMLKHIHKAYELGTINKTQFRHLTDYKTKITERYFENRDITN